MATPTHAGKNSNCRQCHFKRGVGNRAYKGVRIADGPGKCVRPGGLCEAKKAALASEQVKSGDDMAISEQPEKPGKIELSLRARAQLDGGGILAIEHDLLDQITDRVLCGSQRQVATELGISPAFLNDVLRGRRSISDYLAAKLGWKRVVTFIKTGDRNGGTGNSWRKQK